MRRGCTARIACVSRASSSDSSAATDSPPSPLPGRAAPRPQASDLLYSFGYDVPAEPDGMGTATRDIDAIDHQCWGPAQAMRRNGADHDLGHRAVLLERIDAAGGGDT